MSLSPITDLINPKFFVNILWALGFLFLILKEFILSIFIFSLLVLSRAYLEWKSGIFISWNRNYLYKKINKEKKEVKELITPKE